MRRLGDNDNYTTSFTFNYTSLVHELVDESALASDKGRNVVSKYLTKSLKVIAKTISLMAISVFIAPFGACYNFMQALADYPEGRKSEVFKMHVYSALHDAAWGLVGLNAVYFAVLLPVVNGFTIATVATMAVKSARRDVDDAFSPPDKYTKRYL